MAPSDRTAEVAREAYAREIAAGRVQVLTKPNGGKAAALNYALDRIDEEIYVGIDADTVIAADAISKLIPHFEDPAVGAVAGNAKVGNRVNLWTRWQALEYITSQNFERRALDLFNVVTVVPGAIGAWRTAPVKNAGGYPMNTVAEDADLTMNLLEQGFKVIYEDRSLAFTEAPIDAQGADAAAISLVVWHSAGGVEASRRVCAQQGDGAVRAAEYSDLPDAAAAGLAVHRPDVLAGSSTTLSIATITRRRRRRRASEAAGLLPRLSADRLRHLGGGVQPGAAASRQQRRRLAAVPHLAAALCVSAGVFDCAVQDAEARDRRQAIQLGQA